MIFTECPYCDSPQVILWESGDGGSYGPQMCSECDEVMWYECTSFGGGTMTHEDFITNIVPPEDTEKVNQLKLSYIAKNEEA